VDNHLEHGFPGGDPSPPTRPLMPLGSFEDASIKQNNYKKRYFIKTKKILRASLRPVFVFFAFLASIALVWAAIAYEWDLSSFGLSREGFSESGSVRPESENSKPPPTTQAPQEYPAVEDEPETGDIPVEQSFLGWYFKETSECLYLVSPLGSESSLGPGLSVEGSFLESSLQYFGTVSKAKWWVELEKTSNTGYIQSKVESWGYSFSGGGDGVFVVTTAMNDPVKGTNIVSYKASDGSLLGAFKIGAGALVLESESFFWVFDAAKKLVAGLDHTGEVKYCYTLDPSYAADFGISSRSFVARKDRLWFNYAKNDERFLVELGASGIFDLGRRSDIFAAFLIGVWETGEEDTIILSYEKKHNTKGLYYTMRDGSGSLIWEIPVETIPITQAPKSYTNTMEEFVPKHDDPFQSSERYPVYTSLTAGEEPILVLGVTHGGPYGASSIVAIEAKTGIFLWSGPVLPLGDSVNLYVSLEHIHIKLDRFDGVYVADLIILEARTGEVVEVNKEILSFENKAVSDRFNIVYPGLSPETAIVVYGGYELKGGVNADLIATKPLSVVGNMALLYTSVDGRPILLAVEIEEDSTEQNSELDQESGDYDV